MDVTAAERLARRAHGGVVDRHGLLYIDHVARVASAVPAETRVVAWLHDVVEDTDWTFEALRCAGASEETLAALTLLTRTADVTYAEYVQRIADACGGPGRLARLVKVADLRDNLSRPAGDGTQSLRRRYEQALVVLNA